MWVNKKNLVPRDEGIQKHYKGIGVKEVAKITTANGKKD